MPARRRLPALAALLPLLLLLGGCWEVLSYQDQGDSDDLFMDTDGAVEVSPASLSLEASGGEDAKASLTFVETTGERGVEMVQLAVHPGELSVTLVPGGSLEIQVSFSPDGSTTDADAELVVTTTGTPAEMRIPIDTRLEPGDDDSAG
jgi:hypothetical protein